MHAIRRKIAKGGGRGVPIAVLAVLAAACFAAYAAVHGVTRLKPGFALRAAPAQRTIVAGLTARYRISIRRRGYGGPIRLIVGRTPRGILPRLSSGGPSLRMLTVVTSGRARL